MNNSEFKLLVAIISFCLIVFIISSLLYSYWGRVHVDEGFYFVTPYLFSEGQIPYRDYIYTQSPLHAPIYSLLYFFRDTPDFWETRLFSCLFGLFTFLIALEVAYQRGGLYTATIVAILIGCSSFLIYLFSIAKLYPLTGFFLVSGLWFSLRTGYRNLPIIGGTVFFMLATGVRISMAPALIVYGFVLAVRYGFFSRQVVLFVLVGLATGLAIILPPVLQSYDQFIYSVLEYNYAKDLQPLWMAIMLRLDVVTKICHHYYPALILTLIVLVGFGASHIKRFAWNDVLDFKNRLKEDEESWMFLYLWSLVIGLSSLQLVSKSGVVDEYLSPIYPLLAIAVALSLTKLFSGVIPGKIRPSIIVIIFIASLFDFISYGRTAITLKDGKSPVFYYQEVSQFISDNTQPGDYILSFNNSFVIQACRFIVPGYEMHTATDDPEWDLQRCEKFKILHLSTILDLLQKERIAMVILGENSFIGRFPSFYNPDEIQMRDQILVVLGEHYERIKRYPELGYFNADIDIYTVKKDHQTREVTVEER